MIHQLLSTLAILLHTCSAHQWIGHSAPVQDTPEVAHAKAEHFAAVEKAKAQVYSAGKSLWTSSHAWQLPHYAPEIKYHGPIALPAGYDKHGAPLPVADTPEVAHAKAAHLAVIAKAGGHIYPSAGAAIWTPLEEKHGEWSSNSGHYAPAIKYHGPYAYSPGFDKHGAPLPVLETPEVSHAKHQHFAAYAKAAAASNAVSHGGHIWKRSIHEAHVEAAKHAHFAAVEKAKAVIASAAHHQVQIHNTWAIPHYAPAAKYHGPIALPPGYDKHGAPFPVHDTPEVAHAKAAHLAEVAKAGGHLHGYGGHGGHGAAWAVPLYAAHIEYHGPIALPPGYDKHGAPLPVLDTPEVAHAKAAHLAAVAKAGGHIYPAYYASIIAAAGHGSWAVPHYAAHIKYHGPVAIPPGYDKHGAPLPVLDTPEVAEEKAHHHHLYAKIAAEHAALHHHHHHYW